MVPVARGVAAARRVLDLHNVESALVRSYARVGRGPAGILAHAEAAALRCHGARPHARRSTPWWW